ncbi:MAG: hypothetical protein DWP95_11585, partial [Proteobacteria bacterium]
AIASTCIVVGAGFLGLISDEFIRLPVIVEVVVFGASVLAVFVLSFIFFFDRYLIKYRPPAFYKKGEFNDEADQ